MEHQVGFYPTFNEHFYWRYVMELVKTANINQKREFILIDFLPEDFIKDSDFDINEEIILELDF
jgi:hypothetical protein